MKTLMKAVRRELDKFGVLLLTDSVLPSLTTIIAGNPVKGSWWSHPKGNLMYNISGDLSDEPDVLTFKLLNGKLTFVQRRHWDSIVAIGGSEVDWQFKRLPPAAKNLLFNIKKKGELRADDVLNKTPGEIGKLATKLEERLLIYSDSIHTESGKHVRLLKTWKAAMRAKDHSPHKMKYEDAINHFEDLKMKMGRDDHLILFPWRQP